MVDMAYNDGVNAFRNSDVLKYFNAGKLEVAAQDLGEYVHGGGQILLGLVRRCVTRVIVFSGLGGE
jgi:GH24 family phage-related lysozyme (muramidase)